MRYSTYNAIPQYPKSKKHPYETLENDKDFSFFVFFKQPVQDLGFLRFCGSVSAFPAG